MDLYDVASTKINAIEAELQRLSLWQDEPLDPKLFENMTPFGADRMTPAQWLQFVLIPRVREIVAVRGIFPEKSDVALWIAHNMEGEEYAELVHLIGEFDLLINERISII